MDVVLKRKRLTVDQYERMGQVGILDEDDRVELIDGEIIEMSPIGARHMACVNRLTRLLTSLLGVSAQVSVQNPIVLSAQSEPQPDVAVLRWSEDYYAHQKPTARDVLLIIEVGETSFDFDRTVKLPRYARAGIPLTILVDLTGERVIAYSDPMRGGYRTATEFKRGQEIAVASVTGLTLKADDVLG